jgi:hypothetical protein
MLEKSVYSSLLSPPQINLELCPFLVRTAASWDQPPGPSCEQVF